MQRQKSDPDLGLLKFQDIEGLLSYNCKVALPISTIKIEVFFETDSAGNLPSKEQKDFIQRVVKDYDQILQSLSSKLSNETKDSLGNAISFSKEDFDLDTMGFSLNVNVSGKWDLSLASRSDKSISLLANFDNFRPTKVWVERQPKQGLLFKILSKFAGR